jgi:flagellar biosynthesis/type III secretory pathway chaperone
MDQATKLAGQLSNMLELEFQALRSQDIDQFEQLQPVKNELMMEIKRVADDVEDLQTRDDWQHFREMMGACQSLHRRNALLMNRKLEAIRGTLQSLRLPDLSTPVEIYNRLGHIAQFSRNTSYSDA